MAQKISVEVDVNTGDVKFAGGEVTRLAQQVRILTEELNRMQAAGKTGTREYQLLVEKLNDTKDAMDRTKLAAGEIYGTLSALPGPIGEIGSKLNTTIDSFKLLGSLKTTELRAQFVGLLKDVKEAGAGFLNFIGYNKAYEKVLTTLSKAEAQKVAAQKATTAALEAQNATTQATTATTQALATTSQTAAASVAAEGTASKVTSAALTTQTAATTGATIATRILAGVLAALPFVAIAMAIGAAVSALSNWISGTEDAERAQKAYNDELERQDRILNKSLKETEARALIDIDLQMRLKNRKLTQKELLDSEIKYINRDLRTYEGYLNDRFSEYQNYIKKEGAESENAKTAYQKYTDARNKIEELKSQKLQKELQFRIDETTRRIEEQEEVEQKAADKAEERRKKSAEQRKRDLDELQKGEKDAFLETLSDQEKEEYAVNEKYVKLQALAVKYGHDTKQLKESQELELGKIRKKYTDQEAKDKADADKKAADLLKQQTDLKKSLQEKESQELLETVQNEFEKRRQIAEQQAADRLAKYTEELNKAKELLGFTQEEINRRLEEFRATNLKALEVVKQEISDDSAAKKLGETLKLLQVQAEGLVEGTRAYYQNRRDILEASYQQELLNAEKEIQLKEELEKRKKAIEDKYAQQRKQLRQEEFNQILGYIVQGFEAFKSVADATLAVQDANRTVELENAKATIKDKDALAREQDKINEKYFYKQKGAQKAQAYISTFQAAVSAYAAMAAIPVVGPVLGAIAAAAAIVAGLANVKKIDATTYTSTISESGSSSAASATGTKFAKGGLLSGPSHAQGGVKTRFGELEGGEYVVNKRSTQSFMPLLSAINEVGNRKYANGGMMPTMDSIKELMAAQQMPVVKTYVVASEMTSQQEANKKLQDLAKI